MAFSLRRKPGEKRGISLFDEIDISDTSSSSLTDDGDSFYVDESVQETPEETTVSTGSSSTRLVRREEKSNAIFEECLESLIMYQESYNDHWEIAIQIVSLLYLVVILWHVT